MHGEGGVYRITRIVALWVGERGNRLARLERALASRLRLGALTCISAPKHTHTHATHDADALCMRMRFVHTAGGDVWESESVAASMDRVPVGIAIEP